jgi:hypothetical protein
MAGANLRRAVLLSKRWPGQYDSTAILTRRGLSTLCPRPDSRGPRRDTELVFLKKIILVLFLFPGVIPFLGSRWAYYTMCSGEGGTDARRPVRQPKIGGFRTPRGPPSRGAHYQMICSNNWTPK